MKQKLFALSLMALLCLGAWAQQMTVRVIDHFDGPVPGWEVEVFDGWESVGYFTTDENGEFSMPATTNSLEIRVAEAYDSYDVTWDSTDSPVVIKLENYALFTFHWTDRTPELEQMVWLNVNGGQLSGWDENNVVTQLIWLKDYEAPLWWQWSGGVLDKQHELYDVSTPEKRNITITLGLKDYALLTVEAKGLDGELLNADAILRGEGLGEWIQGATYVPAGDYQLVVTARPQEEQPGSMCYVPIPAREISLTAGGEETVDVDYGKNARKLTFTVFDIDENPLTEAYVDVRSGDGSVNAQTDNQGVVRMMAFPGTYDVSVGRCFDIECMTPDRYDTNFQLSVGDSDVEHTVDFSKLYMRLAFDIALPAFVTDPNELQVYVGGDYLYYNESTNSYSGVIRTPEEEWQREWRIDCAGNRMFPKTGQLTTLESHTVTVDLNTYKALVKFVAEAPEKYRLENVSLSKKDADGAYRNSVDYNTESEYEGMYMEPGEYRATVTLADVATGQLYPLPAPVEFAVGNENMEVSCGINEEDYNRFTVAVIGFDGKPIAGQRVHVSGYYQQTVATDDAGKAVFTLPDGEYNVSVFTEWESVYPQQNETVRLTGDRELTISCEGYKPLNVLVSGDIVPEFLGAGYDGSYQINIQAVGSYNSKSYPLKRGGNNTLVNESVFYLPEAKYTYRLHLSLMENVLNTSEVEFELKGGKRLDITLSSDEYHRTAFKVEDENGASIQGGQLSVIAQTDESGVYDYHQPGAVLYLTDGAYKATYKGDNGSTVVSAEDFTVAGKPQTVVIKHRETEQYDLRVRAKFPEASKGYVDGMYITFYMNGVHVAGKYIEIGTQATEGEVVFPLSAGVYTYEVEDYSLMKTGAFTLTEAGQELVVDYTSNSYLILNMVDEAGNPITESEEMEMTGGISRDGYFFDQWSEYYFGIATPGTYKVWGWAYGYRVAEQSVTVSDKGESLTLTLSKADEKNFTVYFGLDEEYFKDDDRLTRGTITFGDFGTRAIGYINLFADVPAGTYPYTLQVEGFATRTGTVVVSEENQWEDEDTPPHIILVELMVDDEPATGMDCLTTPDESFRIFPTVAEDVVHIAPATTAGGEWTVRIVSVSGVEQYAGRYDLTTEAVVPVAGLPEGVYFIHLSNGTAVEAHKFVKK